MIEVVSILIGTAIMAIGISLFLLPNQLSSGGLAGISTIIYYFFGLPLGITMLVINIPLFVFALIKLGRRFFTKAVIGTIALSTFIDFFDRFPALTGDRFLACVYGGIIVGLGTAIILKVKASTGGSDLLVYLIREYHKKIRISNLLVIIDVIVVALNVLFFRELEIGLYSAITLYLMGKIIDIFFEGIYFTKMVFIVSEKNEEISNIIHRDIPRGTTLLYGKGMYTRKERNVLWCVTSRGEAITITQITKQIDPHAFIVISNAREVFGKGFKLE